MLAVSGSRLHYYFAEKGTSRVLLACSTAWGMVVCVQGGGGGGRG